MWPQDLTGDPFIGDCLSLMGTLVGPKSLRWISPRCLDRKGFPEGLLHDVGLMFLAPEGACVQSGTDREGHLVCRWENGSAGTTDVAVVGTGEWRILEYDGLNALERDVRMRGTPGAPLAQQIHFTRKGLMGYTLDLTLVEAEFLEQCDPLFSP